ncbi:MAG: glycosyltransferase [Actinomycetota bacterium]
MAHLLILTSDLASIVNAHAEVARRLRADGHDVDHLRIGVELPDLQGSAWSVRADARATDRDVAIDRLGLEAYREELLARSPDAVLVDIERHEHVAVALTLGVPVALTSSWITPGHVRGHPPLDRTDPAPDGALDRLRNELSWLRRRITVQRPRLIAMLRARGADRHSVLHAFAQRHGVSYRAVTTTDAWLRPWGYRRLPTLVLAPAELELAPDPSVAYLGAMVGPSADEELPPAVNAAIDRHRSEARTGPLVYCSFGSFASSYEDGLLPKVIEAAAGRPDWTLVVALGATGDPDALGVLPDNVVVERWLPQRAVLARADVAVTRAGVMTIVECAVAGVPMVVYSAGLRDQDGNAARVAHHGLGVRGASDDAPATIRAHVDRLTTDASIARRIAEMRTALVGDERVVERAVTELLAG